MKILIAGVSTRALAASAVNAGHSVLSLDCFGDRDQPEGCDARSLAGDYGLSFSPENFLVASEDLDYDGAVYTSGLENAPGVVGGFARRARLLGNGPGVLERTRSPLALMEACRRLSIPFPRTLFSGEEERAEGSLSWLAKPIRGGGGRGVVPWDGRPLTAHQVLQAYSEGTPASASFVADGSRGVLLGITRQLIGREDLGAEGFGWCGNIMPPPLSRDAFHRLVERVEEMVDALTAEFGLRGACGIDFMLPSLGDDPPAPVLLEINPRYTGAMELMEEAWGINIFSMHLSALNGELPRFSLGERFSGDFPGEGGGGNFYGKGIVFAVKNLVLGNTDGWAAEGRRDIPRSGERIDRGGPICSVFGRGKTYPECMDDLLRNAALVRRETDEKGKQTWNTASH